jgi:hypothetical protein
MIERVGEARIADASGAEVDTSIGASVTGMSGVDRQGGAGFLPRRCEKAKWQ